jgi:hypothetical protein
MSNLDYLDQLIADANEKDRQTKAAQAAQLAAAQQAAATQTDREKIALARIAEREELARKRPLAEELLLSEQGMTADDLEGIPTQQLLEAAGLVAKDEEPDTLAANEAFLAATDDQEGTS